MAASTRSALSPINRRDRTAPSSRHVPLNRSAREWSRLDESETRRCRLAALPVWRALLAECSGALDGVLRGEHRCHDLALLGPEGLVVPRSLLIQDRLRGGGGERRVGGDLHGEL